MNQANTYSPTAAAAMEGTLTGEPPTTTLVFVRTGNASVDLLSMLHAFLESRDHNWDQMKLALEFFIKSKDMDEARCRQYAAGYPMQGMGSVLPGAAQTIASAMGTAGMINAKQDLQQLANIAGLTSDVKEDRKVKASLIAKLFSAREKAEQQITPE